MAYSVCTITGEECEAMVKFAEDELGLVEKAAEPMIGRPGLNSRGISQRFDLETRGCRILHSKIRQTIGASCTDNVDKVCEVLTVPVARVSIF